MAETVAPQTQPKNRQVTRRDRFKTNKGWVEVEQQEVFSNPRIGDRVFKDGAPAPDGKYRFGPLWHVHIKDGRVADVTIL